MADRGVSEPYEDLGGLERVDQYTVNGALYRPCGTCGAQPGEKCTHKVSVYKPPLGVVQETRERNYPCLSRALGRND